MNQLQLYINDQLVDLDDDSPIALTFQINNLAEVQNQQGNTSNQFKLPLTQRNRRIFGFPNDVAFTTNAPYQQYPAKLVQDGLEIVPYGIAELNQIDQDTANVTVLSGNVDFFDAIDGKLYDMGDSTSQWSNYGKSLVWLPYDHVWNVQNAAYSQTKTEGWIWPVVDYGMISNSDYSTPIDVHYQRPGFFIKTAVDLLLKSAGYKGAGSLLSDPLYPKLICQFANDSFDHGTDVQNNVAYKSITVQTGQNFTRSHPTVDENIGSTPFSLVISDTSHHYNPAVNGYFVSEITSVTASIAFELSFTSTNPSRDSDRSSKISIQIRLYDNAAQPDSDGQVLAGTTVDYAARGTANTISLTNQAVSFDQVLQPGQGIKITYEFTGYTGGTFTLNCGATFNIQNKVQEVQYGQMIQCERIFPDISQKDLLKDILQRFGIICQTDNANRTISFNSLRDIVNNIPIAKDWSNKCIDQGKQIAFQLGNYGQVNYMKCKEDDGVLPLDFANSQINIADTTLQATNDLFQSQFAPTLNRPFYGGTIAQILKTDPKSDDNEFTVGTQPRLLVDQKFDLRTIDKTVTFNDGNTANNIVINDWISAPYFYKPDGEYNLCFSDMPSNNGKKQPGVQTKYYAEFQKVLTQSKKLTRYTLLTPRDILELDLMIPVYIQQDNAYFYINKIDSWRKGQPCKVELIKFG
ncbi:MAG TPA: hypothetical protein VG367_17370 [Mucilaginibacter sp.]|jgi:hypothetical protein|nr:hypothetical protein [Mucilaginibacter sp.]